VLLPEKTRFTRTGRVAVPAFSDEEGRACETWAGMLVDPLLGWGRMGRVGRGYRDGIVIGGGGAGTFQTPIR
jgi:hypothetical protein